MTAIAVRGAGRRRRRPVLDTLFLALMWWFPTGAQVIERTDATFLRDATGTLPGVKRASRWGRLAGYKRAAVRWFALVFVVLVSLAVLAPSLASIVRAVAWPVFGAAVFVAWWHATEFNRRVRFPLYLAMIVLAGIPRDEGRVRHWVQVPRDLDSEHSRIRLYLPPEYASVDEKEGRNAAITHLINQRIPGEWEPASWQLQRWPFFVELKHKPAPPAKVTLDDIRAAIEASDAGHPVIGLGTRGEVVHLDLDAETPHIAANIGTGGGKSAFLRLVVAQLAHHLARAGELDAEIHIVDPKRISQQCYDDVPGIYIHNGREVQSQWDAVALVREEMDRRYDILTKDKTATFPRWLLVIEEQNTFASESYTVWRNIKTKSDPQMPPVGEDMAFLLFKARQVGINVFSVFQQMNARAAFGSDLRDNYGMKVLARFSPQAWSFLVGTYPRPRSNKHPGRAIVMIGDEQRTVQLAYITEDEAREMALAGREPVPVRPSEGVGAWNDGRIVRPGSPLTLVRDDPDDDSDNASKIPDEIVGLDAGAEFLGLSRAAFEKARQRRPIEAEYRKGNQPAWTPDALHQWNNSRPGKRRA